MEILGFISVTGHIITVIFTAIFYYSFQIFLVFIKHFSWDVTLCLGMTLFIANVCPVKVQITLG